MIFFCKGTSIESIEPTQIINGVNSDSGIRVELAKRPKRQHSQPHASADKLGQTYESATPAKEFRRRALAESVDLELTDYFNNQCVLPCIVLDLLNKCPLEDSANLCCHHKKMFAH